MNAKRIFVSYAPEDKEVFESFIKQSKKENLPFELVYTDNKEARQENWMQQTQVLIGNCDGIIVLISKGIKLSECAFWEMKCSNESGKPVIALFVGGAGIIDKPMDIRSVTAMVLSWERLKEYFSSL